MRSTAVIFEKPGQLRLGAVVTSDPGADDCVVEAEFSGISTGTERLLWSGRMPAFPGLGYPLVPGYETVGRVVKAGANSGRQLGEHVFVPGTNRYENVKGLFGGSCRHLVVQGSRVMPIGDRLRESGILLALAATACHVIAVPGAALPELIVGHGALGRLLARIVIAAGGPAPVVWEKANERRFGAEGYSVIDPDEDARRDYRVIVDMSGDASLLDKLIQHAGKGAEIVLGGFYDERPSFGFVPAFMREIRLRVSAEWTPSDMEAAIALVAQGRLSLDGIITNSLPADAAFEAYTIAFGDPRCLKMALDWRTVQ